MRYEDASNIRKYKKILPNHQFCLICLSINFCFLLVARNSTIEERWWEGEGLRNRVIFYYWWCASLANRTRWQTLRMAGSNKIGHANGNHVSIVLLRNWILIVRKYTERGLSRLNSQSPQILMWKYATNLPLRLWYFQSMHFVRLTQLESIAWLTVKGCGRWSQL